MTRVAATLAAVALVLVGGWWFFLRQPTLLTASGPCFTSMAVGPLVVDPKYGTAIISGSERSPVAWPPGFTSRPVGSEVEVLDPQGNVFATTGHEVTLAGGYASPRSIGNPSGLPDSGAFLVCDAWRSPSWSIPQAVLLPLSVIGLIGTILVLRVVLPRRSFASSEG